MQVQGGIRCFVIVASVIIFCYQMILALARLMGDATVDSTEYISISDLDSPPVITFCSNQGADYRALIELGYWSTEDLLNGNK